MSKETLLLDVIDEISMGPFGSDIKVDNFIDSGVPVLNGANLTKHKLVEEIFNYISVAKADSLGKANARRGDIVITHRGTLGQVSYIPNNSKYDRYVISQSQFRVRFKKNINPIYLTYLFHTPYGQRKLFSFKNHVGVPALAQATSNFKLLKLRLHEKSEQDKIADVLSALDDKIELNNKINGELEEMAKTLYDYWFVQFDFPREDGRPYKSSCGNMVYNGKLKREIPEGWEVKRLGKACLTSLGGTPSTKIAEYWNGNINWLNSGEVANFPIINSEAMISESAIKNSATKLLKKGTVLISITRHLRANILGIDGCVNQSVVGIEENEVYKKSFLYPFISNEIPRLMTLRTGAQQPHINKETVDECLILKPSDGVLDKYYRISEPICEKLISGAKQNQELSKLRDWLLPMLMNGQVTVGKAYEQIEEALSMAADS